MTDFSLDAHELRDFAKRLRVADAQLEKDFFAAEVAAGELVADDARRRAPSEKIAASVGVRRRATRVRVVAGGRKAPASAPLEHHGQPGTFRHPVFGNFDVWVPQAAQPFLTPAARDGLPVFETQVLLEVTKFERRL